ncbi:AAA ATPase-like protein [Kribbella antiqua]|uniref:AAA ATPase-like protein n=1 Tax=Kribbella antiqua TaxID=2512217 RepID=A0A4R2J293_9ACTN|nr:AAA family ATPase [Kribbella antiqua]TCO49445.1 AAA ATPase-like protein [Kribbella antiqua]
MEGLDARRPAMVGRARPLAELDGLLAAAIEGRGRSAVILGEPGMGKTTLAETFADRAAAAGVTVAWGWCSATEMPPFWPWRTILRDLAPQHRLATDQAAGSRAGGLDGPGLLRGDAGARARLFVSVIDALREIDRPVLLIVEDLHWADGASLLLLRTVIDALPGLPVLLVATCRDEPLETGDEVLTAVRALPTAVQRIRLEGLEVDEVAELVTGVLGSTAADEMAAMVHGRTGGNPFFVREVSRLLAARPATTGVPEGVREVLARRIARVSQDCQRILEVAAVAGDGAEVALIMAVTDNPADVVLDLLEEAVRARLLTGPPVEGRIWFTHALVREVLEASLGTARRAALHRALAEQLETGDAEAGEVARHWSAAFGPDAAERAAEWALRAARTARSRMGYEQAVGAYRIALRGKEIERTKVMLELGESQMFAGDLEGSRQTFAQTAELARESGRASHLAMAALGMGTGLGGFEVPLYDELQTQLLEEALVELPQRDGGLRAAVMGRLSLAYAGSDREGERVQLAQSAVEMAGRLDDACVQSGALAAYCDTMAGPGQVDERFAAASRMLGVAERGHDSPCQLLARRLRVVALMERGDWPAVDAEIEAFARTSERLMLPLYSWYVPLWRGTRALMSGDFEAAVRYADEAEAIGKRAGSTNAWMMVFTLHMWTHRTTGVIPASFAAEVEAAVKSVHEPPVALAMAASYYAAAGQLDKAGPYFDRLVGRGLDAVADDCEWLEGMWHAGDAAIALSRADVAEEVARRLAPYEDLWVIDGIGGGVIGVTAHLLGRLAAFLGRTHVARRLLGGAVEKYRESGAAPWLVKAEQDLAAIEGTPARASTAIEGLFKKDGRTWHLRWRDGEVTVPDSKGMHDLSALLARPGEPVHVLDLVAAAGGPPRAALGGDTGPVLDGEARAAYKRRLTELETDIAEADDELASTLTEERDFLVHELAAAYGLGGRARTTGDPAERARKAVAMRIATAIKAIREVHPQLARHLELAVSTGRFCVYRPEEAVTWHG